MLSLKYENNWILILWTAIFMLILVWDQEKIVLLNLIILIYFLRFMVGASLESTLGDNRQLLGDVLLTHLKASLVNLKTSIDEVNKLIRNVSFTILLILQHVLGFVRQTFLSAFINRNANSFTWYNLRTNLLIVEANTSTREGQLNVFSAGLLPQQSPVILNSVPSAEYDNLISNING